MSKPKPKPKDENGPKAPEGKENNWVPTNPQKGFFLVFRFYGPLEGIIDKTWKLNDLELL